MSILFQVLNNRMFNPLKPTEENGNIEHNGNKNDNYLDDNGKIQNIFYASQKKLKIFIKLLFYILTHILYFLGEYKFILPPDEEGMVYQCHLCSFTGKLMYFVYICNEKIKKEPKHLP